MQPRWIFAAIVAGLVSGASISALAATVQITMDKLEIAPAQVSAKVGDTIEWVNKDPFAHTATAKNGDWDVMLPPKKSGNAGFEESRHGRILLPLPSQHEGCAHRRAVTSGATGCWRDGLLPKTGQVEPPAPSRLAPTMRPSGASSTTATSCPSGKRSLMRSAVPDH